MSALEHVWAARTRPRGLPAGSSSGPPSLSGPRRRSRRGRRGVQEDGHDDIARLIEPTRRPADQCEDRAPAHRGQGNNGNTAQRLTVHQYVASGGDRVPGPPSPPMGTIVQLKPHGAPRREATALRTPPLTASAGLPRRAGAFTCTPRLRGPTKARPKYAGGCSGRLGLHGPRSTARRYRSPCLLSAAHHPLYRGLAGVDELHERMMSRRPAADVRPGGLQGAACSGVRRQPPQEAPRRGDAL